MKVQLKVEFGSRPVNHLAIQCPTCNKWFNQKYIVSTALISTDSDIDEFAKCECPACGCKFDLGNVECDENVEFPEFYNNCAARKVVWE
jgi:hypothetical protein